MKLKLMMMVGVMVFFAAIGVNAQSQDNSGVKILRTPKPGVIKLLYAVGSEESLNVKFITHEGEVARDEIRGKSYTKGFMKNYDVRQISNSDFWMEVASSKMTVVYHVVPSKDRKTFNSYLEKTTINHREVVAANK